MLKLKCMQNKQPKEGWVPNMKQIPFLVLYEPADDTDTLPTEEDIANSIDLPDCYECLNITVIANEAEIMNTLNDRLNWRLS